MVNSKSLKLNEAAISANSGEYIVKPFDNALGYSINLLDEDKDLLKINLKRSSKKTDNYKVNIITHLNSAKTVENILLILELQKSFYNKTIMINGHKLFGDILVGDCAISPPNEIDDTIAYWNRISELEKKLNIEFKIELPLLDSDKELLENLCESFIDNKPVYIGHMNYIDIVPTDKSQVESIKKQDGDFAVLMKCNGLNLLGCDLSELYKVFLYREIRVTDYKEIPNGSSRHKKYRLIVEKGEKSEATIKYFRNEIEAKNYLQAKSDKLNNTASSSRRHRKALADKVALNHRSTNDHEALAVSTT